MFPPSETSRSSGTPSSKLDFIASFRRLTLKHRRESTATHSEQYVPRAMRMSSLTTESVNRALRSDSDPKAPPRRVRMSGSRLPSGYRPTSPINNNVQPVLKSPIEPQPEPTITNRISPSPLRTRIARLIIGHTAHAPSVPTPTSSTLSFPSSSRASTSTTASNPKTVRFSPSTSFERAVQQTEQARFETADRSAKVSRSSKVPAVAPGRNGTTRPER